MDSPYSVPAPEQAPNPVPQYPQYQAPQYPQYQAPQPQYQAPQPQYQVPQPQYQAPQPQYQAPQPQYQYPQYQAPQYKATQPAVQPAPKPPKSELVCKLAAEDKKIDSCRVYHKFEIWGLIILIASGAISLLALLLVAGGIT